jgi:hypothetical protein
MTNVPISGDGYQMVGPSPSYFNEPTTPEGSPVSYVYSPGDDAGDRDDLENQETPETAPERPKTPPKGQSSPLICKEGHFDKSPGYNVRRGKWEQPVITRLSLNDDRLKVWADLSDRKKVKDLGGGSRLIDGQPHRLLTSEKAEVLTFGKFTLKPEGYGAGLCSRLYIVHHLDHSDPVIKLHTHPQKGRRSLVWFHLENHLNYPRQAVPLGVELLDALGTFENGLSEYEIAGDAPEVLEIPKFIQKEKLVKKQGRFWRVEVGAAGEVKGMKVNKHTSDRCATIYGNGKTLNRRNRQYISDKAVEAGVIAPGAGLTLVRLEFKIKAKEARRLEYKGQPVTLRTLLDPAARLAIFRGQVESGFVFRFPGSKEDVSFFDWEAIAANYGREFSAPLTDDGEAVAAAVRTPRTARKSNATYGAKQAVKKLVADSRPGDYLVKVLRPDLERTTKVKLLNPDRLKALKDTLSGAGCGLPDAMLNDLLTAFATDAAERLGEGLARTIPGTVALAIAAEHNVKDYHRRQIHAARLMPEVNRLPETLTPITYEL